jgi:hypothetical protein
VTDQAEHLSGGAADAGSPGPARAPAPSLRPLALPGTTAGALWLTGMPDSDPRLADFLADTAAVGVRQVVILTEEHEIRDCAPAYARVLSSADRPFSLTRLPIPDLGVPAGTDRFRQTAGAIADTLRQGGRVAVHCRAGIGRTGLMAQAVLIELGVPPGLATRQVARAGSRCETPEQIAFLREAYPDAED